MPDEESDPPELPSEEEILTAADGDFDIDRWKFAVAGGKYDGHEVEMASFLSMRAQAATTRRWRVKWRDDEITEDTFGSRGAEAAEEFAGIAWGVMMTMDADLQMFAKIPRAILYGIARDRFKMDDRAARKAVDEVPARDLAFGDGIFSFYDVPPVGKADSDSEV